jgi:alpha-1,6-mannosyltransferase
MPHPLLLYKLTGFAMDWMFLIMAFSYIVAVPFNKVEESFNLHAAHDVIMYGTGADTLHNVSRCILNILTPLTSMMYPNSTITSPFQEPFLVLSLAA